MLIPTIPIGIRAFMPSSLVQSHAAEQFSAEQTTTEQPVTFEQPALQRVSRQLEKAPAKEIVRWALDAYASQICVGTSFTDTVLVHLVTSVDPDVEVLFLDTGFHFSETLQTMKAAQARYRLNLNVVRPPSDAPDLWSAGSEACCAARKVDGLRHAMADNGYQAWFSGLRRADSEQRSKTPIVGTDSRGVVKVNPLANWSDQDVADYVAANDLVVNPLLAQGYSSVGCWPCTEAHDDGGRGGRWAGTAKTECGLHLD